MSLLVIPVKTFLLFCHTAPGLLLSLDQLLLDQLL